VQELREKLEATSDATAAVISASATEATSISLDSAA
jgi:hypothetical protein